MEKERAKLKRLLAQNEWAATSDGDQHRKALEILKNSPQLAQEQFCCGDGSCCMTTLMYLIAANASIEIIKDVYYLNPEAVSQECSTSSSTQSLPLHLACEAYAKNHRRTNQNDGECRAAIEFLLEKYPVANTQTNGSGQLPIHCLLEGHHYRYFVSKRTIQILLEVNPENHGVAVVCNLEDWGIGTLRLLPLEQAVLHDYPTDTIQFLVENFPKEAKLLHIFGKVMDLERAQLICSLLKDIRELYLNNKEWWSKEVYKHFMEALIEQKDSIRQLTFYELPGKVMEGTRSTQQLLPQYLYQAISLEEVCFSPRARFYGEDNTPEFAAIVNSICRIPLRSLHTLRLFNFELGHVQPVLKLLCNSCTNLRTIEVNSTEICDPSWKEAIERYPFDWTSSQCENLSFSIGLSDIYLKMMYQVCNMPHLTKLALHPCLFDQEEEDGTDWSLDWFNFLETRFAEKLSSIHIEPFVLIYPIRLLQFLASSSAPIEVTLHDLDIQPNNWPQTWDLLLTETVSMDESPVESLSITILDLNGDPKYFDALLFQIVKLPLLKRMSLDLCMNDEDTKLNVTNPIQELCQRDRLASLFVSNKFQFDVAPSEICRLVKSDTPGLWHGPGMRVKD